MSEYRYVLSLCVWMVPVIRVRFHILAMPFILCSYHLHFLNMQFFIVTMLLKFLILYVILTNSPFCCIYMYIVYYYDFL